MLLFYQFLGNETVVAVALVTLLSRLVVTPLMITQQKSSRKQQELAPKIAELREKHKGDQEKFAQEQLKLYNTAGINPLGGCLPLLIQFPLMIGVYQAIIRTLAATPLQLLALPNQIYPFLPSFNALIPLKSRFLWLDLALRDPYLVLPVLVFITAFLYQKLLTPQTAGGDPQAEAMSKNMLFMMPLMTAFLSASYASGFAIYFLISNLVGILQYLLFRRHYAAPPTKAAEKRALSSRKAGKAAAK